MVIRYCDRCRTRLPSPDCPADERVFATAEALCEACAPAGSPSGSGFRKSAGFRKAASLGSSARRRAVRRFRTRHWSAAQTGLWVAGLTIGVASLTFAVILLV